MTAATAMKPTVQMECSVIVLKAIEMVTIAEEQNMMTWMRNPMATMICQGRPPAALARSMMCTH